jgi:hypothetical protein
MSQMRAAIIGIAGVGKEYARLIADSGGEIVALIDHEDVLERECATGSLHNEWNGVSFDVPIGGALRLTQVSALTHVSILTHVFVCTPPTVREFVPELLRLPNRPIVHVEKPLALMGGGLLEAEQLNVGYLYMCHGAQNARSVYMEEVAPDAGSWRWDHGVAWDLGIHALSRVDVPTPVDLTYCTKSEFVVRGPGWAARARWGNQSLFLLNDQPVDWYEMFECQFSSIDTPSWRRHTRTVALRTEQDIAHWSGYDLRCRID